MGRLLLGLFHVVLLVCSCGHGIQSSTKVELHRNSGAKVEESGEVNNRVLTERQFRRAIEVFEKAFNISNSGEDSDGDCICDDIERIIGTDPSSRDTDNDGIEDSKDINPLSAPRPLNESETLLSVAFHERNKKSFDDDPQETLPPIVVHLPKGVGPISFKGWNGMVLIAKGLDDHPLDGMFGKGGAVVKFTHPTECEYTTESVIIRNKEGNRRVIGVEFRWRLLNSNQYLVWFVEKNSKWIVEKVVLGSVS